VERRHLQGCSPLLSRLRTDGLAPCEQVLNVPITCWWYGPSKLSSLSSTDAWLKSIASLVGLGEKNGYGPMDQSTDML
jgi:hypothetical protein